MIQSPRDTAEWVVIAKLPLGTDTTAMQDPVHACTSRSTTDDDDVERCLVVQAPELSTRRDGLYSTIMGSADQAKIRRRAVLTGIVGVVGTTSLAGCLGANDDPAETPTPGGSGQPIPPSEISFAVLGQACGNGEDTATITTENGEVQVDGVIVGRNTCDTAGGTATMVEGTLVLTVDLPEEEPAQTTTRACAECLTDIEYTFTATFPNEGPSGVRVVHQSANGETTVATSNRS